VTDRRDDELDEDDDERAGARARGTSEGVRILGAEEAQAAMDAGAVGRRLSDRDTRYGDVPPRPDPALRPSVRFPRSADDPAPTVVPRPTPGDEPADEQAELEMTWDEELDTPTEAGALDEEIEVEVEMDVEEPAAIDLAGTEAESSELDDEAADLDDAWTEPAAGPVEEAEEAEEDAGAETPASSPTLPHWSEPPTGEIPLLLPESESVDLAGEESLDAYTAAASTAGGPRFLTGVGDWGSDEYEYESIESLGDEESNVGALAHAPEDDDTVFDREVAARRKAKPRVAAGARVEPRPARRPPRPDEEPAPAREADLTTRVITGVGMAVLALICLKLGRDATTVLATAIVGLASLELFQGLHQRGFRPATILAVLGSIAIVPLAYQRGEFAFPFTLAIVTVFTLLWYLFQVVRARPVVNVAVTVMGFVYVGVLGAFAGLLLSYENGVGLILGVALCVVAYDVVGYIAGSQFGKARVAPMVSPNKTVEGLVAGMVASIVVALVIVNRITPWNDIGDALALGIVVAIAAPLGDLCESMVKRDLGIKDFGTILPGHGGILDRFDAILFCLPAVYYLARALTIG
jgi:phosphatidate cytidylyltransferase